MMDLLGWENWRNWTEQFEKKHAKPWSQAEILERVRRLERLHWTWALATGAVTVLGAIMLPADRVMGCAGIFFGLLLTVATKLASSVSLSAYHILWDLRKSEEEAVRKLEIEDL